MAIRYTQSGSGGILTAYSQLKINDGLLTLRFVDVQKYRKGRIFSSLRISLNGQTLLISRNSIKPDSANGGCGCKSGCGCGGGGSNGGSGARRSFQVINGSLINRLSGAIALLFLRLRRAMLAFLQNSPNFAPNLPCFLRIPICRVTEARVITSCRLSGKPMADCIREGEIFYNECKGDC
ncbi:hypothetical protein A8990_12256 [Paenibacillus taihuensis]|uniref:Uncharacterized protein n=1 Tax=Paenibacillus taihuensis TaxID=1156355 RepID=A0A3D9RJP2_9BACL|nr:hypothetical protein A8990_12256 [Paenibacillus taihuensis]